MHIATERCSIVILRKLLDSGFKKRIFASYRRFFKHGHTHTQRKKGSEANRTTSSFFSGKINLHFDVRDSAEQGVFSTTCVEKTFFSNNGVLRSIRMNLLLSKL